MKPVYLKTDSREAWRQTESRGFTYRWANAVLLLSAMLAPLATDAFAEDWENLTRLTSTVVRVSSVNGNREQDDQFYGAPNLIDEGEHIVNNIKYTYWLSNPQDYPWIRVSFSSPVDVHSIMIELTNEETAHLYPSNTDAARSTFYFSKFSRRPREFAVNVTFKSPSSRKQKLPSVRIDSFRSFYPIDEPLENVKELEIVFPGPSTVAVAELEVLGKTR